MFRLVRRGICGPQFSDHVLRIHPRVKEAILTGKPVVALESTIISHGMPYPNNYETAKQVEDIISSFGVVPATIAILKGKVHVGLEDHELQFLADSSNKHLIQKTSRRDISSVISTRGNGGTTVSSTMYFSHMAGIRTFVTGGIGGVHRFGQDSMDVSADLTQLSQTPVAVVCAGAKSILDIGRTLEYLETLGVPVASIGQDDFPAFYCRSSGFKSPIQCRDLNDAAKLMYSQFHMPGMGGVVFGVPIPSEYELDSEMINSAIEDAVRECKEEKISGKETTPFLLKRVGEVTRGKSLEANIALVKNNARIGAQIALSYAKLDKLDSTPTSSTSSMTSPTKSKTPLFVGVSAVDLITKLKSPDTNWDNFLHTSTPASTHVSAGGVGRNVAEAYARVSSATPKMISPASMATNDPFRSIFEANPLIDFDFVSSETSKTPVYNALLDPQGRLIVAGADMPTSDDTVINEKITTKVLTYLNSKNHLMLACDANLNPSTIASLCAHAENHLKIPTVFEPTSVPKAKLVFQKRSRFTCITPNCDELFQMASLVSSKRTGRLSDEVFTNEKVSVVDSSGVRSLVNANQVEIPNFMQIIDSLMSVFPFVRTVVLKLGSNGVLLANTVNTSNLFKDAYENSGISGFNSKTGDSDAIDTVVDIVNNPNYWSWSHETPIDEQEIAERIMFHHYLPDTTVSDRVVNVNGAGDSLAGGYIACVSQLMNAVDAQINGRTFETRLPISPLKGRISQIDCRIWNKLSWATRHNLIFLNAETVDNRSEILDDVMMISRKCAELSLQCNEAVNPQIQNIKISK